MALPDDYAASIDPRVISQVTAAIYAYAQTVYTESNPPTNHAARAAFASKVVNGQVAFQPLILAACSFASLTAASPDTTVNNAVAACWNTWADA